MKLGLSQRDLSACVKRRIYDEMSALCRKPCVDDDVLGGATGRVLDLQSTGRGF